MYVWQINTQSQLVTSHFYMLRGIYLQLGLPILLRTIVQSRFLGFRLQVAKTKKTTPTQAFQALYRSLASEIAEKPLNVCGQHITA